MRVLRWVCLLCLVSVGLGCGNRSRGGPLPPRGDAAGIDASGTDAGRLDANAPDLDAAGTDANPPAPDARMPDARIPPIDAHIPEPDAGRPGTTIGDIQRGFVAEGTHVELSGVVVTGVWSQGVWVQDPAGGPYSGVRVYLGVAPIVARGDLVDVEGDLLEYFGDTEIDLATVTRVGTGPTITPIPLTVAQASNEQYEGVLVRLTNVSGYDWPYDCTVDNPACTDFSSDLWQVNGPTGILVFDYMYEAADWSSSIGDTRITGVMSYRYDRRRIMPRIASDLLP